MPHVIVKLNAGRSDKKKAELAEAITQAVTAVLVVGEEAVSVAVEDIQRENWVEQVYKPDILGKPRAIYKKPGYDPLKD